MTRFATISALLFVAVAYADVESGPKADSAVAKLTVNVATGTLEGKEVDIAAERKDEPTVYLFVNSAKFDRPLARFIKELDKRLPDANAKAQAFAVWVGGEDEKNKAYLPKVQGSMSFTRTDLAYTKTATPEGWGLNDDAHLTVVVVKAKKVVKVFPFVSVNEKDAAKVLEALK